MSRIAYVNGHYVRHADASVHIEDRGYQFADGVYEVCEISNGFLIDMTRHLNRLDRSLGELAIGWPMSRNAMMAVIRQTVRRNRVRNGLVYMQVTRGVAPRDHVFPSAGTPPALVITVKRVDREAVMRKAESGVAVITVPENRWERVDIKTTGLLPNVMAKQQAKNAGAVEAWFVKPDGSVTEGGATNAWIVTADGVLVTRPAERDILRGITRTTLFDVARKLDYVIEERNFTVDEALVAREAFISSATNIATPVVMLNGKPIANGAPGSVALSLRNAFYDVAERTPV